MICSCNVLEVIDRHLMTVEYAEKIVIGSAICFDECWQKARPLVTDVLFSDERNKFIWNLLKEMKTEGREVDVISLWEFALEKYPQIENVSELAYYICDLTLVVMYKGYDKIISELMKFYVMSNGVYGRQ